MSKGARACAGAACAAFAAESDLTTTFTLVPLAPVFSSTFTPIQCDIASFRPPTLPCDQGYSLYPRLATVFLEAVALPSNFSLLGGVILAVNSSQPPGIQYQDLGNPTNNLNFPPYTPPLGCSLEAPCGDLNASLLSNLTSSGPPTSSSNFSFTSGISQHLLLLASPAFPFPSTLAISIGNVNGTRGAILCRGVRDAPCTITDVQCCRVNWNTPNLASLTTPSFYRGSGSICAGNFWCQAGMILSDGRDLSSYAAPIGDSPYSTLSLINTTRDRVAAVEGGAAGPDSGVFNSSDPTFSLTFSTSYPPAVNLSSVLNPTLSYQSNLPSPLAFATTYGVTLDVVPFPLIFANTFPGTCRGLCLTSQCPAPASPVGLCNTLPPGEWFNRTLPLNCFWGEGVGCKECRLPEGIAGGNCTDGSCMFCPSGNVIVVKKGYWAPSVFSRPESVQACSPPAEIRCLGTPIPPSQSYSLQALVSPQCGKGYTGSYCTLCARGYYVSDSDAAGQSRTCESCPALSDYLRFLETFVITLSAVFAFFMAIYVLAVTLLHSCTVLHLTTWSYTAHYTLKSFVRLVLWGLVATQTASILFNRASAIAAPFLKQLYLILTALQYKGFDNPPLECISVPFPLLWGSILALGASYFFLFVLLPLAFCLPASYAPVGEAGSTSNLTRRGDGSAGRGSRGMAVRMGVGVRRVILFLATPAVLLLTLCFGAMTNAFADTVTCSPPVSITLDKYSSLGGDGSALPPGYPPLDDIRANDPATYYAQNVTVTVTLLVANPSLVCLEGSHIPAYYAAIGGLAGFTFLYPLILLALLHSRGVTLCALFHTPPKAMASSTPWPPSPHQGHTLDSPPSSGPPSSPPTSPRGGGGGVGAGGFPLDDKHAVEKNYFDFLLYLLIDPTVNHSKRVFQPLQYLMLASVSVLLRWGQTFPSSALAANVVLVLFTFAAAVVIKFFFRPYKDKLQWQNSSLASFYFLTAITALCMAVSQSSSSGSNTAVSWIFGLLPVIAAIATVMFVVYKWGRALLKNSQAELLKSQSKGGRSLQTAGAEEDSLVSDGGGGGEVQSYTDNPMGRRPRLEGIPLSGYEQQQEEGEVVVEEEPAIPPGSEIVGADFFNSTILQSSRAGEDAWSPLRSRSEPDTSGGKERGEEGDAWSPLVVEQAGFVPSGRVEDDSGDGNFEGYVRPFGEVIPEAPEDKGVESSPIDSSQPSYHTSKLVELMKKHHRRSSRGSQRY